MMEEVFMKAKATIRLKFPSAKHLAVAKTALQPEASKPGVVGARVTLETEGTFLLLNAEADDTVALRSTLNAYLRWIDSAVNVIAFLDHSS